jgi:S1-C subfamily serine protease
VDRLAVPGEERSGTYLFDVAGNLSGFVSSGTWNGGRQAFSSERLKREINFIIKHHKDIEQRPLGITFKAISPDLAKSLEGQLAGRRAVVVTEILPKTLTADSSLKPNDVLVSIDNRPVADFVAPDGRTPLPEFIHLQADLATRTGKLVLGVIREEKERKIDVPLD